PPTELFDSESEDDSTGNQLVLRIQPNEGASLTFAAKIPGSRRRLQDVRMDFRYGTAFAVPPPEAYERLLLDGMLGDPSLFTRTGAVGRRSALLHTLLGARHPLPFHPRAPRRREAPRPPPPRPVRRGEVGPRSGRRAHRTRSARWRRL